MTNNNNKTNTERTVDEVVEETIVTIIMQAIAPYYKSYKHLGEKSIETAKNAIMQLLLAERQRAEGEKKKLVQDMLQDFSSLCGIHYEYDRQCRTCRKTTTTKMTREELETIATRNNIQI